MGRLGRDPELKTTQAGGAVVSFSMATNEREKQGDQWVDATT
jgi:single-strand DNA-binding protein